MEQKQLDDLDESYFGEEFVDEDILETARKVKQTRTDEDIKISMVADEKIKKKTLVKKPVKAVSETKIDFNLPKTEKIDPKNEPMKSSLKGEWAKTEAPVKSGPIEVNQKSKDVKIESQKVMDPFSSKPAAENSFLKDVSTWKAISGLALVLLIFSIFTQGFQFNENQLTGAAVGKELSLEEAEWRVLDYVNKKLLQPPYIATIENAADAGSLYKLDLSVAGERIISYVTKDGRLFFPQALDISFYVSEEVIENSDSEVDAVDTNSASEATVTEVAGTETNEDDTSEVEEVSPVVESETEEMAAAETKLTAKRWLFSPHQVTVKEGQTVSLMIEPENLDFTFSIPELGVEKEIAGPTTVEFKADKKGSFTFSCSSCEEWRGMTGVLVVE